MRRDKKITKKISYDKLYIAYPLRTVATHIIVNYFIGYVDYNGDSTVRNFIHFRCNAVCMEV